MKLKIKKDRVLSAAEKCPQAKETLKELFPEAFEDGSVNLFKAVNDDLRIAMFRHHDSIVPWVATFGKYSGAAYNLSEGYKWRIEDDLEHGGYLLIPTKKQTP